MSREYKFNETKTPRTWPQNSNPRSSVKPRGALLLLSLLQGEPDLFYLIEIVEKGRFLTGKQPSAKTFI